MEEGVCNLPNCSLKKRVGLMWRSEPGAFVPASVSVSMCLKFSLKVEKTFLLDRWCQVVPESLDMKLQADFQTLRMWFLFPSLSTPGNCQVP